MTFEQNAGQRPFGDRKKNVTGSRRINRGPHAIRYQLHEGTSMAVDLELVLQSRKPGDYHKSNLEVVTPYTQARRTHFLASNVSAWQGESRYRCARTADSSGTTTTIDRYLGSKTLWRPQLLNSPQFCLPCVPQTMLVNRTILIRPRCKQLRAANTRAPIAASNNNYNNNRMNVLIQYPSKERFVRSHLLQQIDALNLV